MSDYLISEETMTNLADSVRTLSGETDEMTPNEIINTINNTKNVIDSLNEHIDDKNNPHNVKVSQITDFPTSLPASDVPAWAKEAEKPSYTASEVGAAEIEHKHNASDITSGTIPVIMGGTGRDILTSGSYLVGNGTDGITLKTKEEVKADLGSNIPIQDTPPEDGSRFWMNTSMKEEFGNIPVQPTEPVGSLVWIDTSEKGAPLPGNNNGFCPQIIVIDEPDSTVTCVKENITLVAVKEGDMWIFDVPEYGNYVVTVNESIKVIAVDAVKQYLVYKDIEQEIHYTMLYDQGDECTAVTGGWNLRKQENYGSTIKNSGDISLTTANGSYSFAATGRALDLSSYACLMTKLEGHVSPNSNCLIFGVAVSTTNFNFHYDSPPLRAEYYYRLDPNAVAIPDGVYFPILSLDQVNTSPLYVAMCLQGINSNAVFTHAAALKEDNWQELAALAGIQAGSMDQLLAQSAQLLGKHTYVNRMVKTCTGTFMAQAIQSETFLTALETSLYKELVYSNEHWAKFLAMVS